MCTCLCTYLGMGKSGVVIINGGFTGLVSFTTLTELTLMTLPRQFRARHDPHFLSARRELLNERTLCSVLLLQLPIMQSLSFPPLPHGFSLCFVLHFLFLRFHSLGLQTVIRFNQWVATVTALMIQWQNSHLPCGRTGFDSWSVQDTIFFFLKTLIDILYTVHDNRPFFILFYFLFVAFSLLPTFLEASSKRPTSLSMADWNGTLALRLRM